MEIKQHPFLQDVDWNAMLNKKIPPPLAIVKNCSNFDQKYTKMKLQFDENEEDISEEEEEEKVKDKDASEGRRRNKRALSFSNIESSLT